jgi:hypothetical protein
VLNDPWCVSVRTMGAVMSFKGTPCAYNVSTACRTTATSIGGILLTG